MFICALLVYYFLRWKKNHIQVRAMELNYNLLEEDYNDLDIRHEVTKEDRSKLQKAWIVQLSDVTLEVVIGKGAFGEVWKGNWRGMDVALKKMFPEAISAEYYSDITNVGRNTTVDNNNDNNELNKVALAMLENKASTRIMEKTGMTFEKMAPYEEGEPDAIWYSINKKTWRN